MTNLPLRRIHAIESGSKFYFTRKKCKYGHVSKRYTMNGLCFECSSINNQTVRDLVLKNNERLKVIFEYWVDIMGKDRARTKLDKDRMGYINRALANYSDDDLMLAIKGCSMSDWHMGANPQSKLYNGIGLILRNAEKIENFISIAKEEKPGVKLVSKRDKEIVDFLNKFK